MAAELSDDVPNTATTPSTASPPIDLTEPFMLGDWRVEPALRRACNAETIVKIDPRNLRVLQILAERRGQLIPQREIEALAWQGVIVTPDSLYQSIRQLRQALRDTKAQPKYIETISRKGYRLVAEVRTCAPETNQVVFAIDLHDEPSSSISDPPPPGLAQFWSQWLGRRRAMQAGAAFCIVIGALAYVLIQPFSREIPQSLKAADDVPRADASLRLSIAEQSAGSDVQALRDLGMLAVREGRSNEAIDLFQRALGIQLSKSGEQNERIVELLTQLASAYFFQDDDVAARSTGLRAMSILEQLAPVSSPGRIQTLSTLGDVLVGSGDYGRADPLLTEALRLSREYYGDSSLAVLEALAGYSSLRFAQGKLPEAEASGRQALKISGDIRGPQDLRTAYWHTFVAAVRIDRGKYTEAEAEVRRALEVFLRDPDSKHPYLLSSEHVLAEALVKQGRVGEAEPLLRKELSALQREGAVSWRVARAASTLGEALILRGDLDEAQRFLLFARGKLAQRKGWPAEREHRLLNARLQMMSASQADRASVAKLQAPMR
jgi:DNA-binding winged helix-turn-helix (wHTH) protein/Flp pilus assembly protein TadD